LINKDDKPLKMKCIKPDQAIFCAYEYGPVFGKNDLKISSKSNKNTESNSSLGDSYKHPDYAYESDESRLFLVGTNGFRIGFGFRIFSIICIQERSYK